MTNRYHILTVLLKENIREDDAQPIIEAIKMIKGVIKVEPQVANFDIWAAEHRAKMELRERLWEVLSDTDACDIKEIAANINQDLLAACQAVLARLKDNQPLDDSIKAQLQEAIEKPHAVTELEWANNIYERYIVVGEVIGKINNQAVYDLLRGIAIAICLTMTEEEAEELIRQINAQEIVNQYGHIVEYGKVIRKRSEVDSEIEPSESGQDSDNPRSESL